MQELKHSREEITAKLLLVVCMGCGPAFTNTLSSQSHSKTEALFLPPFCDENIEVWAGEVTAEKGRAGISPGHSCSRAPAFLCACYGFSFRILSELIFLPLPFYWWVSPSPDSWITQTLTHSAVEGAQIVQCYSICLSSVFPCVKLTTDYKATVWGRRKLYYIYT